MKAILKHVTDKLNASPEDVSGVSSTTGLDATLGMRDAVVDLVYTPFTDDPKWFGFEIKALKTVERYPKEVRPIIHLIDEAFSSDGCHCFGHYTTPSDPRHHRLVYRGMKDGEMFSVDVHVRIRDHLVLAAR